MCADRSYFLVLRSHLRSSALKLGATLSNTEMLSI